MIVYCTTNLINGMKYIGSDSINNPKYLGSGVYLRKAIKEFGRENFKKEIIEYCDSLIEMRKAEVKWITFYNAHLSNKFYNISGKGQGLEKGHILGPMSDKTKKKIGKSIKNNKERGKKIGNSNRGRISPMKGKTQSEEWKKNMSLIIKKDLKRNKKISKSLNSLSKKDKIKRGNKISIANSKLPIIQYSLEGNFIKEWISAAKASKELDIQVSGINCCLKGKYKFSGRFKWKYKNA